MYVWSVRGGTKKNKNGLKISVSYLKSLFLHCMYEYRSVDMTQKVYGLAPNKEKPAEKSVHTGSYWIIQQYYTSVGWFRHKYITILWTLQSSC